jgi:hypothetical protein
VDVQQTGNGPVGFLGTLLAKLNMLVDHTTIPTAENSLSISKSVQSNPTPPVPWSVIQAQQQAFGGGPSAGTPPGNGLGQSTAFNPFTGTYSIPTSGGSSAAPNFLPPPTQPQLQAAIQATKPVTDNLHDIRTMQTQQPPSQQNNSGTWQNPDPYNTKCTFQGCWAFGLLAIADRLVEEGGGSYKACPKRSDIGIVGRR